MDLPEFIKLGNQMPALRFLVIGAHAVAAHGHTRFTEDVDFLINRNDSEAWLQRLSERGLTKFSEFSTFAQFSQDGGIGFDLMFVKPETFEPMWEASIEK